MNKIVGLFVMFYNILGCLNDLLSFFCLVLLKNIIQINMIMTFYSILSQRDYLKECIFKSTHRNSQFRN